MLAFAFHRYLSTEHNCNYAHLSTGVEHEGWWHPPPRNTPTILVNIHLRDFQLYHWNRCWKAVVGHDILRTPQKIINQKFLNYLFRNYLKLVMHVCNHVFQSILCPSCGADSSPLSIVIFLAIKPQLYPFVITVFCSRLHFFSRWYDPEDSANFVATSGAIDFIDYLLWPPRLKLDYLFLLVGRKMQRRQVWFVRIVAGLHFFGQISERPPLLSIFIALFLKELLSGDYNC